jgi:Sigma-70 factor, region 1.1/Protein of unknown function (DUF551)
MTGWKPIATAPQEAGRPLLLYPRPSPRGHSATRVIAWDESAQPLLDLADITVRQMIKLAKKRGYITYDELDQILPPDEFSVKQIDDVIDQLCEMGIDLVEPEEIEESRSAATGRERTEDDQVAPAAIHVSVFEGYWDGRRWRTSTGRPCEPTHWMPLPSPPLTLVRQ